MASITLSVQEYQELKNKAEDYNKLWEQITQGFNIEFDDSRWYPFQLHFKPNWTEEQQKALAKVVGDKFTELADGAMVRAAKEAIKVVDFTEMDFTSMGYRDRLYYGQYDMRVYSEKFATEFEQAVIQNAVEEDLPEAIDEPTPEPTMEPEETPTEEPTVKEPTETPTTEEPTPEPVEEPVTEPVTEEEDSAQAEDKEEE